jgi:hypothetical protein
MSDPTIFAAASGVDFTLQDAQTTGNGNVLAIPPSIRRHNITIIGGHTVSTGAIQIESADTPDYSGTWGQIGGGPITIVDSTSIVVTFEGIFNFIRTRISTNVTGTNGTVSVVYRGTH